MLIEGILRFHLFVYEQGGFAVIGLDPFMIFFDGNLKFDRDFALRLVDGGSLVRS